MVGTLLIAMDDLSNRLETFADWPSHVPIKPKNLAEAGFYYVGEDPSDDTVCCFSCGGKLDGWKADDNPEEKHRRYFGSHCEFIQDKDSDDVCDSASSSRQRNYRLQNRFDPIEDDDMENEEQRIHSFQRNNGWSGAVDPRKLAAAGFYFTGIDDKVKCFACDVSLWCWEPEDDPISEHLKKEPECPYLSRLTSRLTSRLRSSHIPVTTTSKATDVFYQSRPNYTETTVRKDHKKMTPNYAREQARLHTFINWPKECPVQPKELIDAGFYYTGEEDKAKCFQCGVILAGWEPEDTPWGEHQKWSKDCPLVRQRLLQRNPHSPVAGTSRNASGLPQEQTWQSPNVQKSFPSHNVNSFKYVNLDPSEEEFSGKMVKGRLPMEQNEAGGHDEEISMKKTKVKEEKEIFHIQKAVQELIDRGYDLGMIEETIQYKTKVCKESIDSVEELHDAVVSFMEMNGKSNEKQNGHTSAKQADETGYKTEDTDTISEEGTGFSLSIDPETLHQQVEKMREAHLCKICLDADIGVVFLPCGHLICCPKCATEIQNKIPPICPVCRRCIGSTIRTYLP